MKEKLILFIKGFVMGIANIIPGVSGGTLAMTLGIYEQFISSVGNLFKNFKKNLLFLIPVVLGMGLSILSMSHVISYSLGKFPVQTGMFFMGLVIGGIPMLISKVKGSSSNNNLINYLILVITFTFVLSLAFSNELFGSGLGDISFESMSLINYVLLLIVGMIAAGTMIIPGVSGSLVLILLGYYKPITDSIKELTSFNNIGSNLIILSVFGIGILLGIILIAKLLEFLFKKYEKQTYFGVIGFIFASVIAIPVSIYHEVEIIKLSGRGIIFGLIFMVTGIIIGNKLGEK